MSEPSDQIVKAARFIFDRANPDVPGVEVRDRNAWFNECKDYWVRAAVDLAELLDKSNLYIQCGCGWFVIGPPREAGSAQWHHRCPLTPKTEKAA
jgi:hypothetical protein